jgi:DHA1 family bicyclomycin/chloramphenicol resistance-like MFS transporter
MSDLPKNAETRGLPYWELVTMIACLMALNAAAIDIFIPSLQEMGAALGVTDENQRQLVITAYILGFGGAQIVYGTLSDRFGRRPILFFGLTVYILASVAAIFSPTFGLLLALRAVQGIGAAATRVIAISVVRDCFGGRRMASVMSLVMMVFMAIPVIAPNIGQAIMLFGSWREVFIAVAAFGLFVAIWSAVRLPETLAPADRRELTFKRISEAFRIVLTNRVAFGYTISTALIFGVLFGFINQAEQIYTGVYGLGPIFTLALLRDGGVHGRRILRELAARGAAGHAPPLARGPDRLPAGRHAAPDRRVRHGRCGAVLVLRHRHDDQFRPVRLHRHELQRAGDGSARPCRRHGLLGTGLHADPSAAGCSAR